VSKQSLCWFESYLIGREQGVVINNVRDTFRKIKTGIPQGTLLGPVLFSLYINDLTLINTNKKLLGCFDRLPGCC